MVYNTRDENFYLRKHPEMTESEVFLGNFNLQHFELIGWTTKRRGSSLFSPVGLGIDKDSFPVFVNRDELISAGLIIRGFRIDPVKTFIFKGK